ncbi:MAG: serine hydrolase [Flavobacteriaceae bacterium]|jgi:CubicO group peptidase (beta-lactamase class C family)|nr:serine hydrolase [Flavobacteriaceae bacterium]
MKILKRIILFFTILICLLIVLAYIFKVDYILKAIRITYLNGHKTAFLTDYQEFYNRTIGTDVAQPWHVHTNYNTVPSTGELDKMHQETGTIAFLIIKNDSIWHESYYDGFEKDSKSNSFSMAKSIVSAALGKAIMQQKIKDINQPVKDFIPEIQGQYADVVTVGDLSSMASGLDWDESYYSPFSVTTRAYFDEDLNKLLLGLKITEEPGKSYKYLSGATQLLGMVIEKATGEKLTDYISENFWKPMGAENEALWQVDNPEGIEKAYCCIASNARDFARFGKLYKQKGNWNGQQLLDSTFVEMSVKPRFKESPEYGYGWWLSNHLQKDIFYMNGHLGQYVIVIPEDELIIVRLGHRKHPEKVDEYTTKDFNVFVEEAYKMLESKDITKTQ